MERLYTSVRNGTWELVPLLKVTKVIFQENDFFELKYCLMEPWISIKVDL